jgi:hypothetical protein
LTGIYTFYTGEANINADYPLFDRIFTSAHELSHQRGFLLENEANFVAYLVTSGCDEPIIRYSAALTMYSYISSALYRTDGERYSEISSGLCVGAISDLRASSQAYYSYSDTVISEISDRVNDLFLKSNGTPGTVSYGMVVELMIAYLASGG